MEHEPELAHLLTKLYERQRAEAYRLLDEAVDDIHPEGEAIEKLKIRKEEFRDAFHKECGRFAQERDRIIEEFKESQRMREERHAEEDCS